MACTKSELISAINSFGAARASGDANLIEYSGRLLVSLVETLEFADEDTKEEQEDIAE
jgi:hypothetical protein